MYQDLFNSWTVNAEKMFAPSRKLADLTIASTEKLFALQMALTQGYFELGMKQLKSVLEVKDAESLKSFVSLQAEVAKNVGEKVMADAKAVADLNAEVGAEVQKLTQESLQSVVAPRPRRRPDSSPATPVKAAGPGRVRRLFHLSLSAAAGRAPCPAASASG